MIIREALTFDDVLLEPGRSDVMPSEVAYQDQADPHHQPRSPDRILGHGHGDRSHLAISHGAGRRASASSTAI